MPRIKKTTPVTRRARKSEVVSTLDLSAVETNVKDVISQLKAMERERNAYREVLADVLAMVDDLLAAGATMQDELAGISTEPKTRKPRKTRAERKAARAAKTATPVAEDKPKRGRPRKAAAAAKPAAKKPAAKKPAAPRGRKPSNVVEMPAATA